MALVKNEWAYSDSNVNALSFSVRPIDYLKYIIVTLTSVKTVNKSYKKILLNVKLPNWKKSDKYITTNLTKYLNLVRINLYIIFLL